MRLTAIRLLHFSQVSTFLLPARETAILLVFSLLDVRLLGYSLSYQIRLNGKRLFVVGHHAHLQVRVVSIIGTPNESPRREAFFLKPEKIRLHLV